MNELHTVLSRKERYDGISEDDHFHNGLMVQYRSYVTLQHLNHTQLTI